MNKQLKHLSDLKASRTNPREITTQNLSHLKSSIDEFGDISGIVFNRCTSELVCGHQRVYALKDQYGDLGIVGDRIETPNGESFDIRIVDWDKDKQAAAMIAANSPTTQGTFTNGISSLLNNLEKQLPNVYESLGFESLRPREIASPESWAGDDHMDDAPTKPWKDSQAAREGKPLSESIADDVTLEARFEVKVPETLAKKATKLLLDLISGLPGATVKRLD